MSEQKVQTWSAGKRTTHVPVHNQTMIRFYVENFSTWAEATMQADTTKDEKQNTYYVLCSQEPKTDSIYSTTIPTEQTQYI